MACDDAHFNVPGRPMADAFGGWVVVRAVHNTAPALLAALKAGAYYATQGPQFHRVTISGNALDIACSPVAHVALLGRGARVEHAFGHHMTAACLRLTRFEGDWARHVLTDAQGRQARSNSILL
ncbi:hypothetical protein [Roseicitreum antarcticum]|uniref:hypothetical protein n=1 Tax=Roseicitreum antarcticum TaxID=564137 RepID=UPI0015A1F169|nr:hypothetical protein [Roseicitreum antarcticum]